MNLVTPETVADELAYIQRQVEPGTVLKIPGMLTRREFDQYQRWKMSQWFLVRNDGATLGEVWACRNHKATSKAHASSVIVKPVHHTYFTVACQKAPFRGLDGALMKYVKVGRERGDPRAERRRLQLAPYIPELADYAPDMAKRLAVPKTDAYYAIAVALTEPITPEEAQDCIDEIAYATGTEPPFRAVRR